MEIALLYVLLFWEKSSMRTLLRKNLIAHKRKNKLTAIIYSLSLGSIIFLLTSANLQIKVISSFGAKASADIIINGKRGKVTNAKYEKAGILRATDVDDVIRNYTQI